MKYNQPYGVSDPNAPYINGNPSTGTMGSIPPAASIEYPQRELVAAIAEAGLTPDNADLTQLLKMMKIMDVFNFFKLAVNGGTASQWSAAVPSLPTMPPPVGTTLWFKPNFDSVIGGTVFSVNGSAFKEVRHPDLKTVTQGDVVASAWLLLFFDGNYWLIIAGSTRIIGALPLLQKNTDWYVNGATGDDVNYDGTTPNVVSATVGPFKTIQRAATEILKYNMNNYNQTINVADGNYPAQTNFFALNGTGTCYVKGNQATPQNVNIAPTAANACGFLQADGNYNYSGFRFTTGAGCLDGFASNGGRAVISNLRFGPCARYHISAGVAGAALKLGTGGNGFVIEAGATASAHLAASLNALLGISGFTGDIANHPSLNILGPVNLASFANADSLAVLQMHYASIVGAGNVTGSKYSVTNNAVMSSLGGGPSHFPGSTAGTLGSGGQYS
jgi:hypothetical protein